MGKKWVSLNGRNQNYSNAVYWGDTGGCIKPGQSPGLWFSDGQLGPLWLSSYN